MLETSGDLGPLAPEPSVLTGALVGYARVSTKAQLLDRQIHALTEAGCIRVFSGKKSGKNAEREELWKALDHLRPGDTLGVPSLDRPGRSFQDLIALVSGLRKGGVGFTPCTRALTPPRPAAGWSSPPAPAAPAWAALPPRPRPVHPPREHRRLHRQAPRRLPQHHLQVRS
ncbi:MAG TPA: recombinase family protein [Streptomyces sp.]